MVVSLTFASLLCWADHNSLHRPTGTKILGTDHFLADQEIDEHSDIRMQSIIIRYYCPVPRHGVVMNLVASCKDIQTYELGRDK